MIHFQDLPLEIHCAIALKLDLYSLLQLQRCSKFLYGIINEVYPDIIYSNLVEVYDLQKATGCSSDSCQSLNSKPEYILPSHRFAMYVAANKRAISHEPCAMQTPSPYSSWKRFSKLLLLTALRLCLSKERWQSRCDINWKLPGVRVNLPQLGGKRKTRMKSLDPSGDSRSIVKISC